jgi:thiamine-monophosphate kinase
VTHVALADGAEFDRIRDIASALGARLGPIGDDTASVPDGTGQLVVSTDTSVEGVHFRRAWVTPGAIGWRATAAAVSDLAAVGAEPVGVMLAVTVPAGAPPSDLVEVMRGAGDVCARYGGRILGGDLSAGEHWSLTVTVLGYAPMPVMSRRGAQPGDGVWVTGSLGGARAALLAWNRDTIADPGAEAAFLHPEPRIAAGRWLAAHGATAMLDLSDGLAGDARHLAAASDVTLTLDLDRLPLHPAVAHASAHAGEPRHVFAAIGGEDYELLVTMPEDFGVGVAVLEIPEVPLTRIGSVSPGPGITRLTLAGAPHQLRGYVHRL